MSEWETRLEDQVQDHERRISILEAELTIYRKGDEKKFLRMERDTLQGLLRDSKALAEETEEIRRVTQCKLTDICSDIWDLARRYNLSTEAEGRFNEQRATLKRIIKHVAGEGFV